MQTLIFDGFKNMLHHIISADPLQLTTKLKKLINKHRKWQPIPITLSNYTVMKLMNKKVSVSVTDNSKNWTNAFLFL